MGGGKHLCEMLHFFIGGDVGLGKEIYLPDELQERVRIERWAMIQLLMFGGSGKFGYLVHSNYN